MSLELYIKQLNETMQEFVKLKEEKEQNGSGAATRGIRFESAVGR